jgi:competence protein ComGC
MPAATAPEGLAARTVSLIQQRQRVEALIAREESARPASRPMFSLRELAAVAAVLVMLATIFVPSIRQAHRVAQVNECAANVGQIGSAMLSFANDHNDQLPGVDGTSARWLPSGNEPAVSNSSALFKLVRDGYASPVVFQCPALGGRSFAVQAGFMDFPAGQYIHYSYQYSLGHGSLSRGTLRSADESMAILADSTPLFADGQFHPADLTATASENHDRAGQNVLYVSGQVRWASEPDVGVNGDNIFLADGVSEYHGTESPAGQTDTFLLPNYSASGQ